MNNAIFVHRPKCNLCGSDANKIILSKKMTDPEILSFLKEYYEGRIDKVLLDGSDYAIVKCQECEFVWQAWILNEDMMHLLYENWISAEQSLNKKKFGEIALFRKYANEVKKISPLISKSPHQIDVLDFGMGWGYWANMAKAFGYNVMGFELSQERIRYAKQMGIEVIDSLNDKEAHKFDFINAHQVFEHIIEPLEMLKHLSKKLKNNGVIRISVPNGSKTLEALTRPDWKARKDALQPLEHINCFTHSTLKRLGKNAGLSFIEIPSPMVLESRIKRLINLFTVLSGRFRSGRSKGDSSKNRGTTLYFRKEQ